FMVNSDFRIGLIGLILILSVPYILLLRLLRYPLSEIKYKLTEHSFEQLRANGVAEEVIKQLEGLKDHPYPNRDRFLDALQQTAGNIKSVKTKDIILTVACEEGGEED